VVVLLSWVLPRVKGWSWLALTFVLVFVLAFVLALALVLALLLVLLCRKRVAWSKT
jgi:hypothetical protein